MTEIVVVGAGLVGASIARHAADRGARVHVIEASRPAAGTSLATFSWVNAVGKQPRGYFDLNVAGVNEHRRLVDELGGGEWYHPGGNLEWSSKVDELRAKADHHRGWGYPVEWLEPAQGRALEPDVVIDDDAGVAFYPEDAWVDPALLVRRLLEAPGLTLSTHATVEHIATVSGRIAGLELADGRRLAADAVVIATGPSVTELLGPLGFDLPMRHTPGLLVITEPAPIRVARMLHAPGLAARPDGAGRLLLASDELDRRIEPAGGDVSLAAAAEDLLGRAGRVVPRLAGVPLEAMRIGRRALTGDGLPAIGPVPGCDGAYLAVMHSGITLAPLIGRLVARELLEGRSDEMLDDYRPQRFAGPSHGDQAPVRG